MVNLPKRIHLIHAFTHTHARIHVHTCSPTLFTGNYNVNILLHSSVASHYHQLPFKHIDIHTLSFNCPSVKCFSTYFLSHTHRVPLVHSSMQTPHGVNLYTLTVPLLYFYPRKHMPTLTQGHRCGSGFISVASCQQFFYHPSLCSFSLSCPQRLYSEKPFTLLLNYSSFSLSSPHSFWSALSLPSVTVCYFSCFYMTYYYYVSKVSFFVPPTTNVQSIIAIGFLSLTY